MTSCPPEYDLAGYAFALPEELIAQEPIPERGASRLMTLDRNTGAANIGLFKDILHLLPERCLLIANNSRVFPARLHGRRPTGGKVEFLLLTPPPLLPEGHREAALLAGRQEALAEGLLRSSKQVREGEEILFGPDLSLKVQEWGSFGHCRVSLSWQGRLTALLARYGAMPLPPYIRRPAGAEDARRYQTTYARADKAGSVAAPTAGLHFTPQLRKALEASGREWAEVTLYVGYGTFSPVRCRDIREHPMHAEYAELPAKTAQAVARAKAEGRAVIAVGTTSARVLEGIRQREGQKHGQENPAGSEHDALSEYAGWINIFLYPGKEFKIIDGLITNFHLPESSLLMLVCALAGREAVLAAYRQAVQERFRFFSYGDAMLIL
jgi:S-adenosylmethionine:tRNA ribosyltransferase-isomerase